MKNRRLILQFATILGIVALLNGCHFVGDREHSYGYSGLIGGVWDGAVIAWSSVMAIFSDVDVLQAHNSSTSYKFGFAAGVVILGWNLGLLLGIVSFVLYILPL